MTFVIIMPPQVSRSGRNMILSSAANSSLSRSMRHKDIQSSFYYFHLTSMLRTNRERSDLFRTNTLSYQMFFNAWEKGNIKKGTSKKSENTKIQMSALPPLGYQKAESVAKIILDSLKAQGRYAASEPNLFTLYFAAAKKHSNRQSGLFTNKR